MPFSRQKPIIARMFHQLSARLHQPLLRSSLVKQRTRWKNQVHTTLHRWGHRANVTDLFGRAGRAWLAALTLPPAAQQTVNTLFNRTFAKVIALLKNTAAST